MKICKVKKNSKKNTMKNAMLISYFPLLQHNVWLWFLFTFPSEVVNFYNCSVTEATSQSFSFFNASKKS